MEIIKNGNLFYPFMPPPHPLPRKLRNQLGQKTPWKSSSPIYNPPAPYQLNQEIQNPGGDHIKSRTAKHIFLSLFSFYLLL